MNNSVQHPFVSIPTKPSKASCFDQIKSKTQQQLSQNFLTTPKLPIQPKLIKEYQVQKNERPLIQFYNKGPTRRNVDANSKCSNCQNSITHFLSQYEHMMDCNSRGICSPEIENSKTWVLNQSQGRPTETYQSNCRPKINMIPTKFIKAKKVEDQSLNVVTTSWTNEGSPL